MAKYVVKTTTGTINYGTLTAAMLGYEKWQRICGYSAVTMLINDIVINYDGEDDTFLYASIEAAEHGNVWLEELHQFVSKEFKSSFEAECFDTDDYEVDMGMSFWESAVDNVYQDIFGYTSVTGEDGQAIVRDANLAEECKKSGYDVLPCGNPDKVDEYGNPEEYWLIFPNGGEDKYFEEVYAENNDIDMDQEADFGCFDSEDTEEPFESAKDSDEIPWDYDADTHELTFESPMVHAYWDSYEGEGSLFLGVPSRLYGGFKVKAHIDGLTSINILEGVIRTILDDPEDVEIRDGKLYRRLAEMPFDRWDDSTWSFHHPTGWEYLSEAGTRWINEYEEPVR